MEVSAEAKRIMVVALGKLYSSRTQRGGLRLHRSLLLTMVMKSARDIYHAAQEPAESVPGPVVEEQQPPKETEELRDPAPPAAVGHPRTSEVVVVVAAAAVESPKENKENQSPTSPPQHSRKRRGKAAVEPDFLPCKKAKLDQVNKQILVSSVLMDYVICGSGLGSNPTPMPLHSHRAIAAC